MNCRVVLFLSAGTAYIYIHISTATSSPSVLIEGKKNYKISEIFY